MAYRFLRKDRSVQAGLRRIAGEQIDGALASLAATGAERAAAVHDVRKRCKKLRALVRIVRPVFADYALENAAFRAIARPLGAARDAKVLADTLDLLVESDDGLLVPAHLAPALAEIRYALAQPGTPAAGAAADLDASFADARARLQEARERASGWRLEADGWDALAPGIAKVYAAARRARRRAAKKPTGERHHEWRKRVKDHWYHTRLLRGIRPDVLEQRAALAGDLGEVLGHHHDCCVFAEAAHERPEVFGGAELAEALATLATRRRTALEARAAILGAQLQADRPAMLVDTWGDWWHAWTPARHPVEPVG